MIINQFHCFHLKPGKAAPIRATTPRLCASKITNYPSHIHTPTQKNSPTPPHWVLFWKRLTRICMFAYSRLFYLLNRLYNLLNIPFIAFIKHVDKARFRWKWSRNGKNPPLRDHFQHIFSVVTTPRYAVIDLTVIECCLKNYDGRTSFLRQLFHSLQPRF